MPWPLQEAINHGLSILSWFESYVEDEIPPEPIWDDSDGVSEWFKKVRKQHDDRMGGAPAPSSDDGEPGDGDMMGNDLASYFRE